MEGRQQVPESQPRALERRLPVEEQRYRGRLPPFRWQRRRLPIRSDDDGGGVRGDDTVARHGDAEQHGVRQDRGERRRVRSGRPLQALLSVSCSCVPSLSVIVDNMVREPSFENLTKIIHLFYTKAIYFINL